MPYINSEDKQILDQTSKPRNAGELNYTITTFIHNYFVDNGMRYQQINDILGALEGAKLEFYRKVVVPYENQKIELNGDVMHPSIVEKLYS